MQLATSKGTTFPMFYGNGKCLCYHYQSCWSIYGDWFSAVTKQRSENEEEAEATATADRSWPTRREDSSRRETEAERISISHSFWSARHLTHESDAGEYESAFVMALWEMLICESSNNGIAVDCHSPPFFASNWLIMNEHDVWTWKIFFVQICPKVAQIPALAVALNHTVSCITNGIWLAGMKLPISSPKQLTPLWLHAFLLFRDLKLAKLETCKTIAFRKMINMQCNEPLCRLLLVGLCACFAFLLFCCCCSFHWIAF